MYFYRVTGNMRDIGAQLDDIADTLRNYVSTLNVAVNHI